MRIKVYKGSKEEQIIKDAGVVIKRRENMDRNVYIIHPMDNIKLIGCLSFDYYEEVSKLNEQSSLDMLFMDSHSFDMQVVANIKNPGAMQLMCVFVRLGEYLASSDDVIIKLDSKSPVYQQYIEYISGLTLAKVTDMPKDKILH